MSPITISTFKRNNSYRLYFLTKKDDVLNLTIKRVNNKLMSDPDTNGTVVIIVLIA